MNPLFSQPGWDTWLARLLHERRSVALDDLQSLLSEARAGRAQGLTLARLVCERGLLAEGQLEGLLREGGLRHSLRGSGSGTFSPEDTTRAAAKPELGPYRKLELLGSGGMGAVYRVEHTATGAHYAAKTLTPIGEPDLRARFEREAEAQARVDAHENVVRVHAFGKEGEQLYLVMELVEGGDLAARLRQGPLEPRAAAALARDLARGLAHTHAHGVLHRDLKPQNVLLTREGAPKLVDFGLARVAGAERLTQTGMVLGTPAYMAPEQARGESHADERTDVYGLGAILYECLTARPPFEGASVLAVLAAVTKDAPRAPRALAPGIDERLEAICLRALAKAPADRFGSAGAFADALEGYLQAEDAPRPRRSPLSLLVISAAAGLAVALGVGRGTSPPGTPSPSASAPTRVGAAAPYVAGPNDWPERPSAREAATIRARLRLAAASREDADPGRLALLERLGPAPLGELHLALAKAAPAGRELSDLRAAVRYGDREACRRLARAYGLEPADPARGLGLLPRPALAAALARVGFSDRATLEREAPALSAALSAADTELPRGEGEAYATIRAAFAPAWVAPANALGEASLALIASRLTAKEQAEVVAPFPHPGSGRAHDRVVEELELGALAEAVVLLRHEARRGHSGARHGLARILATGQSEEVPLGQRVPLERVPLAGLWRLVELAEAGSRRAMVTLATIYAFESRTHAVHGDVRVAAAWAFLAGRPERVDKVEYATLEFTLREALEVHRPASRHEAWQRVRRALPWNLSTKDFFPRARGLAAEALLGLFREARERQEAGSDSFLVAFSIQRAMRTLDAYESRAADDRQRATRAAREQPQDAYSVGIDAAMHGRLAQALVYLGAASTQPEGQRALGRLLVSGQVKGRVSNAVRRSGAEHLETVPVAGIWLLWRLGRADDMRAGFDLAYLYAHVPTQTLYVPRDLRVANAWLSLAGRGKLERVLRVREEIEVMSGALPPLLRDPEQARGLVRAAPLPWGPGE